MLHTVAVLQERIKRVEEELDIAHSLLSVVLQQLKHSLGDEALCPVLRAVCAADDAIRIRGCIDEVDGYLAEGKKPLAARTLREWLGMTWDDVHNMIAQWPTLDDDRKVRWMQRKLLTRALANAGNS